MTEPTDVDRALFAELRRMWETEDPMPESLVDDVLVALAVEDLAAELITLRLVSDTVELVGARAAEGARVLQFTNAESVLMLRVSETSAGALRIDGWMVPSLNGVLQLERDAIVVESTTASPEGRFEFRTVATGPTRLTLASHDAGATSIFTTESFTI